MKKRILIYSTAYYPFVGGAEIAIKEVTDRLVDFEFVLITALLDRKLPCYEKIGNVEIYRINCFLPSQKLAKIKLALKGHKLGLKLHKEKPFDIVWAMLASYGGFAARKFKLKTKVKYLLSLQEGDPIEEILKKVRFNRKTFNQIFTAADGLQSISNYLHEWGFRMGFQGNQNEVIPNGVDIKKFTYEFTNEELQKARHSFNFPQDSVILVTDGRVVKKNGLGDVIEALAKLPEKYCFLSVGTGNLLESLKLRVKELGLEKRVNFMGFKDQSELPIILKASDIFIRPSLTEGLGNSFLEAMASGLPVIGTLVGGIPDFLKDGETGIVCQPQNIDSIIKAITRANNLKDEEKKELHMNSMKLINDKYNWEYISERMKYMFKNL